jgi:Glycosyl hydrolases family 16
MMLTKTLTAALAATIGLTGLAVANPVQARTVDAVASVDAHVGSRLRSTNYDSPTRLLVDGRAQRRKQAFLKFTVPAARPGSDIDAVVLRLHPHVSSPRGVRVYRTGKRWPESGLTWSTRPARRTLLGASGALEAGTTEAISLDADKVAPGTVLGLRLETSARRTLSFGSSEASRGSRPVLRVRSTPASTTGAPTTPSPTAPPSAAVPAGVPGPWNLAFADEFSGTALDLTKWRATWFDEGGSMNNVGTHAANVTVTGGEAQLRLSSPTSGALIHTGGGHKSDEPGRYALPVGGVAEARVWFPGNGSTIHNWPAFWANDSYDDVSGQPVNGEHDIAEVLGTGQLTVNYHSPTGAHNQGAVPGYWGNAWHTYAVHRKATTTDVYWDGRLVKSYPTDDGGQPVELIFNVGTGKGPTVTGDAGALRIDYVRAWAPAS